MEATHTIEDRRQRLIEKAARRNKKSKRLQKKIQREMEKKNPNMTKVSKWQDKSAKHVDKGLRYMDQMKTLGQDKNDQKTKISFKLEKVGLCEFSSQYKWGMVCNGLFFLFDLGIGKICQEIRIKFMCV